jgi:hypothetical protein
MGRPTKVKAMKKFTCRIPEHTWEATKIRAIQERRDFQEIVDEALRLYLAKTKKGGTR